MSIPARALQAASGARPRRGNRRNGHQHTRRAGGNPEPATMGVVVADRWYPSSKTCSACGAVKAKLTLAQRQFVCESCGTHLDRDYNAALNLAALADQAVHGQLDRDVKLPAGNPGKTATRGNGYRHGKTQITSQRRPARRRLHETS